MNLTFEKIKTLLRKEWYVEHADARPFFLNSGIGRAFVDRLILRPYSLLLIYYKDGQCDWMTLVDDQKALFRKTLQMHQRDKNYWPKTFQKYLKLKENLEKAFQELKDKNIRKVSNQEIIRDIKGYINCQLATRRIDSVIDAFAFRAEEELYHLLLEWAQKKKMNLHQAFEILARPETPSFLNEAEAELIKICQSILKNKKLKLLFLKKKRLSEKDICSFKQIDYLIKAHLKKYAWLKIISFYGGKEYSFQDACASIKELLETDLDEKKRQNKEYLKNKRIKRQFIAKHHFNQSILDIVTINTLFSQWQDLRKENTLITSFLHLKYLKEISRRTGLSVDDLAYLDYLEVPFILNGQIDVSLLRRRKAGLVLGLKGNQLKIFNREETRKILESIFPRIEKAKEFKGTVASRGYIKARVKIIRKIKDIQKIKQGEIIAAPMTRPEHTPALKKVSAIITDDGGITCHAAIVSRELGIPCIIGTKIATKVLKDGDLVEVDTEKGVVRILKRR